MERGEKWFFENRDEVVGITFLPYNGGVYALTPYEEITEQEFKKRKMNPVSVHES